MMFHGNSSGIRRTSVRTNQKRRRAAAAEAQRFAVEALERRVFLSVSAQTLAGPIGVVGNAWTYKYTAPGKTASTGTLTSKGTVAHGDQQAIEIDATGTDSSGNTGTEQIFYANLTQGIVLLETTITSGNGGPSGDETWAPPYHLIAPASLDAGVSVTTPTATATQTITTAGGVKTTTTSTKSDVITLATATPSVAVAAAGTTYMCYEVDSTETTTSPGGSPTTSTTQTFVSPTIGVVQINGVTTTGTSYSYTLTKFTGTTYQLAVTRQPSNTLAGEPINPAVQVTLQDGAGNTDTNASDAVTITASIDPASTGTGTLTGNTATTVNGVATFSSLSINKPGKYVLDFKDSAGRTTSSGSFQVSAGKLVFLHPIKNGVAGSSLEPTVEVELEDSKGHKITDAPTSLVTLNIIGSNASNPISGNTAQLVDGVAVFRSVKLSTSGMYTLNASDDQSDVNGMSNQFEIAGPHLVYTEEPAKAGVGGPLRYKITLKNSKNNTVSNSNDFVEFTLNPVGGATGTLSSVSDILSFGVADDSDHSVSINSPGAYTLTATLFSDSTMAPVLDGTTPIAVTSKEFQISADQLKFTKPLRSTGVNIPLAYQVTLEDYKGEKVASGDTLRFNLITVSGGSGAVLAGGMDSLLGGVANNSGGIPRLSINVPGTYKIAVIDVPPNGAAVAKGAISEEFKVK